MHILLAAPRCTHTFSITQSYISVAARSQVSASRRGLRFKRVPRAITLHAVTRLRQAIAQLLLHRVPDRRRLVLELEEVGAGFLVLIVSVRVLVRPLERAAHAHSSVAHLPVVHTPLLNVGPLHGIVEEKSVSFSVGRYLFIPLLGEFLIERIRGRRIAYIGGS